MKSAVEKKNLFWLLGLVVFFASPLLGSTAHADELTCEVLPSREIWRSVRDRQPCTEGSKIATTSICTDIKPCEGSDCNGPQSVEITNVVSDTFQYECKQYKGHFIWFFVCRTRYETNNVCDYARVDCTRDTACGQIPYFALQARVKQNPPSTWDTCASQPRSGQPQDFTMPPEASERLAELVESANRANEAQNRKAQNAAPQDARSSSTLLEGFIAGLVFTGEAPTETTEERFNEGVNFIQSTTGGSCGPQKSDREEGVFSSELNR